MPEHIQYEDDDLFNRDTHHESSDVPIKPLFVFIVIFVAFAFFTHFLVFFMYKGLRGQERKRAEAPFTKVVKPDSEKLPPGPQLQPFPRGEAAPRTDTPVADLTNMRAREDKQLNTDGPGHISIEKAKALAVQQLNAPPATATTTTTTGGAQ